MPEQQGLSVEAQLAVLNTKLDSLIAYNQQRGEDHESRLRSIEGDYVSEKQVDARMRRHLAAITIICVVLSAVINTATFLMR